MREIKFRGKREDNGEWVVGDYTRYSNKKSIIMVDLLEQEDYWVSSETVGQYTGLKDKNGKEIYEGDIVTVIDEILGSPFCDGITGKIVYDEAAFLIVPKNVLETQWLFNECAVYEVIGNIYEDPLVKEST